jgi:hypothetical protein
MQPEIFLALRETNSYSHPEASSAVLTNLFTPEVSSFLGLPEMPKILIKTPFLSHL